MIRWILLVGFITSVVLATGAEKNQPNVILILADDMAVGDLSCFNKGRSRTPNLDRLKSESVYFSQAYSGSSVCAPARASLLTGRYPHRTGVVTLNMEKYPEFTRLRLDEETLADRFRSGGYRTGIIGKWHLGLGEEYHPLRRGFDEVEVFLGHLMAQSYFAFQLDVNGTVEDFNKPNDYLTSELSSRAIDFVRRNKEAPFFLHLAHYAPHRPIDAPVERVKPYLDQGLSEETATVYAMIEIMDEGIGALLEELDKLGIAENTIIIFASDNGPDPLVEKRFNNGLRGAKYEVHEGGIRVPFMVRWDGRFSPGGSSKPIHFADVFATLVELCGLPGTSERGNKLDGVSFRNVLEGGGFDTPKHRFWQWNRWRPRYTHNAAMREGGWKLVRPFVTKNMPKEPSRLTPALFHLDSDPSESNDVAAYHPDRVKRMNAALRKWTEEIEKDRKRPAP